MDSFLLSILTCPRGCQADLHVTEIRNTPEAPVKELLECPHCHYQYPVVSGIPVLFPDETRIKFALDKKLQTTALADIEAHYQHRLGELALAGESKVDAMAWEHFLSATWATNERMGKGHQAFFESVMAREAPLGGKVMLNVGCGADPLLELFMEQEARVVEQDIVLDGLLPLVSRGGWGICGDLRSLPLKTGIFDIITSYLTIHHIWPIEEPIGEMCRVLKPGGSLLVREANALSLTSRIRRNLPHILERLILRFLAKSGYAESPYERFINPLYFTDCCRDADDFASLELGYPGNPSSKLKGAAITSFLVKIIPSLSSSFEVYARKAGGGCP